MQFGPLYPNKAISAKWYQTGRLVGHPVQENSQWMAGSYQPRHPLAVLVTPVDPETHVNHKPMAATLDPMTTKINP